MYSPAISSNINFLRSPQNPFIGKSFADENALIRHLNIWLKSNPLYMDGTLKQPDICLKAGERHGIYIKRKKKNLFFTRLLKKKKSSSKRVLKILDNPIFQWNPKALVK